MTNRILHPWRQPLQLWRELAHVVLSLPIGTVTFAVVLTLVAGTAGLLATFLLAVPAAWLMFVISTGFSRFERHRFGALLGTELVDPVPPLAATTWLRRLVERLTSKPRWKEIGFHLAQFPLTVTSFTLVIGVWGWSVALLGLPLYVRALPGDTAKFGLFEVALGPAAFGLAALGAVGLAIVAPWLTAAAVRLHVTLARRLLSTSAEVLLAQQLARAEDQRSAAVDSAESERRRIERDLHDGAQQRLVALAAGLGAAREKFDADPEEAKVMVASAHEEAKAALKEIRDLVRGIHPVILADRGLDAALSAVVARAPVPVTLDVVVDPRPGAATESAAYFVVSEALTNVARHAEATRAQVSIARSGDRLVLEVRDDGKGGADASKGTGLQGLRERVAGMGGTLHVISPTGGPTTISVELPCGS